MSSTATPSDASRFRDLFLQLVQGHLQMTLVFLGRLANPQTGKPEAVNLEAAQIFIDQLEMLEQKTRGNLSNDEGRALAQAITVSRMAFVEVSGATKRVGR